MHGFQKALLLSRRKCVCACVRALQMPHLAERNERTKEMNQQSLTLFNTCGTTPLLAPTRPLMVAGHFQIAAAGYLAATRGEGGAGRGERGAARFTNSRNQLYFTRVGPPMNKGKPEGATVPLDGPPEGRTGRGITRGPNGGGPLRMGGIGSLQAVAPPPSGSPLPAALP